MKKLLLMVLLGLAGANAFASSSCPAGKSWKCSSFTPPAIGTMCGCVSSAVSNFSNCELYCQIENIYPCVCPA